MQGIHHFWRVTAILACLLVWTCVALAASANLDKTPQGWDDGNEFSDGNGYLVEEHGADNTWAEVRGKLEANDPADTVAGSGGAQDRKICIGEITDAEVPAWVCQLSSTMRIASEGGSAETYDGDMNGVARGVLAIYGNSFDPIAHAREAKTSTSAETGAYNIQETIGGQVTVFNNGGMCKRPSDERRTLYVRFTISFDDQSFGTANARIEFTYESRATGNFNIDFDTQQQPEWIKFEVNQDFGQWEGLAVAWDLCAQPYIIEAFVLE